MRTLELEHKGKTVEIQLTKDSGGIRVFVKYNGKTWGKTFPRKKNPKLRITQNGNLGISFRRTKHTLCLTKMTLLEGQISKKKRPRAVCEE